MGDLIDDLRHCSDCAAPGPTGRKCGKCFRCLRRRAADELTALREWVAALEDHIREQSEHCRVRIQDGDELGARVWRIALQDIARENAAILSHPQQGGEDV